VFRLLVEAGLVWESDLELGLVSELGLALELALGAVKPWALGSGLELVQELERGSAWELAKESV
jgi:hypothetical protein